MALALAPIVLAAIQSTYRAQIYALAAHNTSFGLQETARGALDLIVREVRMAGYDPTGAALGVSPGPACPGVSQGIVEGTPTRLRVQADVDGDGLLTGVSEDVTYNLDFALRQILRTDNSGTVMLADDVPTNGLQFRYFDGSDPPVEIIPSPILTGAQRDCVGTIAVVVRTSAPNPDPNTVTDLTSQASSQVAIRSRALINF